MYRHLYGLTEKPFQISADPAFLWLGGKHREALAILVYGVRDSKGFLLLSGGVGTGKTTLIRALLSQLDKNVVVATVQDPGLKPIEFFNFLAAAYGMRQRYTNKVDFLFAFEKFLRRTRAAGRSVLLIVDEAQRLEQPLMEEIRLLSNIEDPDQKLLNVFFVGQEEFLDTIAAPVNRALKQRITINYHLANLNPEETRQLVRHRLKVAGASREIFTPDAFPLIHQFSQGAPRLINILCDHALLTGFVKDVDTIDETIIAECIEDLMLPGELPGHLPAPSPEAAQAPRPTAATVAAGMMLQNRPSPIRRSRWPWATAAGLLLALSIGVFVMQDQRPLSEPGMAAQETVPAEATSPPGRPSDAATTSTAVQDTTVATAGPASALPADAPAPQALTAMPPHNAGNPGEAETLLTSRPPGAVDDTDVAGSEETMMTPKAALGTAPPENRLMATSLMGQTEPASLPPGTATAGKPAGDTATAAVSLRPGKPQAARPDHITNTSPLAGTGAPPATTPRVNKPPGARAVPSMRQGAEVLGLDAAPATAADDSGEPIAQPAKAIAAQTEGGLPAPEMVATSATAAVTPPPSPIGLARSASDAAEAASKYATLPDDPPPPATAERLRDFIDAYCRAYENRDLDRFRLFFADDALENGQPFNTVLPTYRRNFAALTDLAYTIDLRSWEKEDPTGGITLNGVFKVRYCIKDRGWHTTQGTITMDLVSNGGVYRVKRLEYKKRSD